MQDGDEPIFDAAAKEARQKRLLKEAREQGLEQGEHHQAVTMARKMLLAGEPVHKVVEFTDLTLEEVQRLKEELQ